MAFSSLPPIFASSASDARDSDKDTGREVLLDFDPAGSQATKVDVQAAPSFKGTFNIRNGMPPVTVDNALSLEMEMADDGPSRRFCLRARLLAPGKDIHYPPIAVILPTASEAPSSHSHKNHYLGPYRLRIIKLARIANDSPTRELWVSDVIKSADFAVCVAVDIPILAPMGTLQEAAALGREVRAMRVLRAIDVGESTEVWLSTRSTRDQHIVIGRSEEDQLEIRLTAEATHSDEVGKLSDAKNEWDEKMKPGDDDVYMWNISLDIVRLGEVEAHACLSLNYRDRKKGISGAVRPESRTKSKLGKSVTAGDYAIHVRERTGSLLEMGVSGKKVDAAYRYAGEEGDTKKGLEEVDWEKYDEMEEGRTRVVQTAYPLLHFGVLVHVARLEAKDAEDSAWARLLG